MIIKPSTKLRNDYTSLSDLARETQEPIYITKNGEGDLVVMNTDAFEKREELIRLRARLELAEQSRLSAEPAYTLDESRRRVEKLYQRSEK